MRPNEGADEEIKDSSKFKVVWTPEVRFVAISSRLVRACAEPSHHPFPTSPTPSPPRESRRPRPPPRVLPPPSARRAASIFLERRVLVASHPHRALTLAIATATDLRAGGRASDRARRSPRPEELVVHRARAERSLVAELQTAMVQPVKPRAETRYLYPRGGADAARGVQEVGQSLGRHREGLAGSDGQRGEESPQL
jgi:hypothetical protein